MDKKKISIIVVSAIALVVIGLGFNSLFSKANKDSNNNTSNIENNINDKKGNDIEDSDKVDDTNTNKIDNDEANITDVDKDSEENADSNKTDEKDISNKEDEKNQSTGYSTGSNSNGNITANNTTNNSTSNGNSVNNNTTNENKPLGENKPSDESNSDKNDTTVEENKPTTPIKPEVVKETVTISISCKTAINSGLNSKPGFTYLPSDGMILYSTKVEIQEGDTVFSVLQRITRENGIHMEYTGSASTIYIEGINNLYEFDGGQGSGWMYNVNGWYPNYGCGSYTVQANDVIQWNYTLDLGNDLGAGRN